MKTSNKITPKAFKKLVADYSAQRMILQDFDRNLDRNLENITYEEFQNAEAECEKFEKELQKVEKVSVSFYIGNRRYYELCYKVGKSIYRQRGFIRLGKDSGYTVIDTITDEMSDQMRDDSNYY